MGRRITMGSLAALGLAAAGLTAIGGDASPRGPRLVPPQAERTWNDITEGMNPAAWPLDLYTEVRPFLGPDAPDPDAEPEAYAAAFNAHYGLSPAPYPNDGLPMGLRRAPFADGRSGITGDCLVCHGGSIGGTSYVGLGNSQLDLSALMSEFARVSVGRKPIFPFTVNSVRGTNNAWQFTVMLMSRRDPDMTLRAFPKLLGTFLPEADTPAWWNLRKKRTKYYTGYTSADSHRSNMQFLMGVDSYGPEEFAALEPKFRDLHEHLKTLEPPKYPFPVDAERAERGRKVFEANCASCHGTYGDDWTYPNRIIPLDVVGTDPALAENLNPAYIAHYNAGFFGTPHRFREEIVGYQAPPLDGIWATAPYLHNGSVPTLHALLDSSTRPDRFTRPPSTDFEHYDTARVGWTYEALPGPADADSPPTRARSVYDTTRWGLSNEGHLFGDMLDEAGRMDLIEYLKTL